MSDKLEVKVTCESPESKSAFINFVANYKEQIVQYMNTLISNTGTPVDAGIEVKGETIEVYQLAPDKGFVLGEQVGNTEIPVQLVKYPEVKTGERYCLPEKDRVALYWKTEAGKPDVLLGMFKTMSDSVNEFNSQSVKDVMNNWSDRETARAKEDERTKKRLKKLGKAVSVTAKA